MKSRSGQSTPGGLSPTYWAPPRGHAVSG
ncbi:hypothetical protein LINGRAHAP2_LOCUS13128 [Linum grandiflorum]